MQTNKQTIFFILAFILLFALFYGLSVLTAGLDWTWSRLLIGLVTTTGVTIAWSLLTKTPLAQSFRQVGLGIPDRGFIAAAVVVSALMLAFFPLYAALANVVLPLQSNWLWILIGIVAGVGIAEEVLFRGFAFHFLRQYLTFGRAATVSMLLFAAMHLLLLLWLPLTLAIAAILLAIIAAYPTAYLFEKGNRTIWAPSILHTTALATNLFVIPAEVFGTLSLVWIGVVVIGLVLVSVAVRFVVRSPNGSTP